MKYISYLLQVIGVHSMSLLKRKTNWAHGINFCYATQQ